jgi:hypothetical protein
MRLTDQLPLNFNNKVYPAAVFLNIEQTFDTTWQPGLLYKISKLHFSTSLVKPIRSFLSKRKFKVSVEADMSTPRKIQEGATMHHPVP